MKKSLLLLNEEFESSSRKTPQYLTFHRTFKTDFKKALASIGCINVDISKPNHFDVDGFFTAPSGQIYYFSISDLRWSKENILVRTAKHYKDWTGGSNQYVKIDEDIINNIQKIIS